MSEKVKYFAYGSSMDTEQLKSRGATIYNSKKATLPGWHLKFTRKSRNRGAGVADIVPGAEEDVVKGIVFTINKENLADLDGPEGRRIENDREVGAYRRQYILVQTYEGLETVVTYVVNKTHEFKETHSFKPSQKYMQQMIQAAKTHKLGTAYIEKLKAIQTT